MASPLTVIGYPTTKNARRSMAWHLSHRSISGPLGSAAAIVVKEDMPVDEARNAICREALIGGADYVIFFSDDILPPSDVLARMLAKIGQEYPDEKGNLVTADMITGVYWTKSPVCEPYLYRQYLKGPYKNWTVGEFFPIDMAGCDCLIISARVLRETPYPWFSTKWSYDLGQKPQVINTEDFYFFLNTRNKGFRLFADTAIQCGHEDRDSGAIYGLTPEMPQAGGLPLLGDAHAYVADIGAGFASPFFGYNTTLVRFDAREDTKPDVRCDILDIPAQYHGQFDVVHTRHVLEHIERAKSTQAVTHWSRLLKPGGKLIINVPNVEQAARDILNPDAHFLAKKRAWDEFYGAQSYPLDFHKQGFTPKKLMALMENIPGAVSIVHELRDDGRNIEGVVVVNPPAIDSIGEWAKATGVDIDAEGMIPVGQPVPPIERGLFPPFAPDPDASINLQATVDPPEIVWRPEPDGQVQQ